MKCPDVMFAGVVVGQHVNNMLIVGYNLPLPFQPIRGFLRNSSGSNSEDSGKLCTCAAGIMPDGDWGPVVLLNDWLLEELP